MGFFKNFFSANDEDHNLSEEEQRKLDSMMNGESEEIEENFGASETIISPKEFVATLSSVDEINRVRNLLDKREKELTPVQVEVIKEKKVEPETKKLPEVEKISEYETQDEDDEFATIDEISSKQNEEIDRFFSEAQENYNELVNIFGKENLFKNVEDESSLSVANGKPLFQVGFREKDAFKSKDDAKLQNSWFIANIKQFSKLKSFKMLRSDEGMKDLICEMEGGVMILSFRATDFLDSKKSFDFSL